jgi:threonine dehydrogenase-like Zn-dependent dehydrogenase
MSEQTVVFAGVRDVRLETCEGDARPLAAGEIRGQTLVSLISPGTELAALQGQANWAKFPFHPGYAAVFRVTEVGLEVKDFRAGDLAFNMGGHRSWQRCSAADALAVPVGLPPETAGFARMMGVSMSTLTTTTARPPSPVIVTGLGLVGNLAAQVFSSCGYRVLAVDPDAGRRAAAQDCGLKEVHERIPEGDAQVKDRVSLVIECSGHEMAIRDALRVIRKRGEVVLTGVPWQRRTDLFAHELLHLVFHRYAILRSGWEWEVPRKETEFQEGSISGNLSGALRWLAEGRIKVAGLADLCRPSESPAAYANLIEHRGRLSAVIDWR